MYRTLQEWRIGQYWCNDVVFEACVLHRPTFQGEMACGSGLTNTLIHSTSEPVVSPPVYLSTALANRRSPAVEGLPFTEHSLDETFLCIYDPTKSRPLLVFIKLLYYPTPPELATSVDRYTRASASAATSHLLRDVRYWAPVMLDIFIKAWLVWLWPAHCKLNRVTRSRYILCTCYVISLQCERYIFILYLYIFI